MIDIAKLKDYCSTLHVLYVEDDEELHQSVLEYLKKLFKSVDSAYDGEEGLSKYKSSEYDIVITDITMPKLKGLDMAGAIKKMNSEQEIVIISANSEQALILDAIHLGVSDYILKPINHKQINSILYKVSKRVHMVKENIRYRHGLEEQVIEQTKLLTENYEHTLTAMVEMIENRDSYTGGHSQRVATYSKAIALEMKLSQEDCDLIFRAGMLHDIGKVTTPDSILLKPGKLSKIEYSIIKSHVTASHQLLSKIPMYAKIAEIVLSHHEKHDGSGYPHALKGSEIPILSQIMIIADAFDAMTTNRIYKARKTTKDSILEIEKLSGSQFNPDIIPYACKALGQVAVSDTCQLPKNRTEEERFSYYFRDNLTNAYNCEYLNIFIGQIDKNKKYNSAIYLLKNFTQYNKEYGWNKGNKLLMNFTQYIKDKNPEILIFRIHGDDFIVITENSINENFDRCEQPHFLLDTNVTIECNIIKSLKEILEGTL